MAGHRLAITCVYGANDGEIRHKLWEELQNISASIQGAWIIGDNFNYLLRVEVRHVGHLVQALQTEEFVQWADWCLL